MSAVITASAPHPLLHGRYRPGAESVPKQLANKVGCKQRAPGMHFLRQGTARRCMCHITSRPSAPRSAISPDINPVAEARRESGVPHCERSGFESMACSGVPHCERSGFKSMACSREHEYRYAGMHACMHVWPCQCINNCSRTCIHACVRGEDLKGPLREDIATEELKPRPQMVIKASVQDPPCKQGLVYAHISSQVWASRAEVIV